jgi:hypothetical protein
MQTSIASSDTRVRHFSDTSNASKATFVSSVLSYNGYDSCLSDTDTESPTSFDSHDSILHMPGALRSDSCLLLDNSKAITGSRRRPEETGQQKGAREPTIKVRTFLAFTNASKMLAQVVKQTLKIVEGVSHDILSSGIELLEFVPIPGVAGLAKTILSIWNELRKAHVRLRLNRKHSSFLIDGYSKLLQSVSA